MCIYEGVVSVYCESHDESVWPWDEVGRNRNEHCRLDDPFIQFMTDNHGKRNAYRMSHVFGDIELSCGETYWKWSGLDRRGKRADEGVIQQWSYQHYLTKVQKIMMQNALNVTRSYRDELWKMDVVDQDESNRSIHLPMVMLGMYAQQYLVPFQNAIDQRSRAEVIEKRAMIEERDRRDLDWYSYG